MRLLLNNPTRPFFVRELSRRIGAQINAVRNEIETLTKLKLLLISDTTPDDDNVAGDEANAAAEGPRIKASRRAMSQRKYYRLNTEALIYPELRDLFLKAQVVLEKDFVQQISEAGNIAFLSLSGFFVGEKQAPTDVFIVGRVSRDKILAIIRSFEREIGREINFTIMNQQEYRYRREVTDRFLYSILESRKMVVVDTLTNRPLSSL